MILICPDRRRSTGQALRASSLQQRPVLKMVGAVQGKPKTDWDWANDPGLAVQMAQPGTKASAEVDRHTNIRRHGTSELQAAHQSLDAPA
jgi:hypothetical protein